MSNMHHLWKSGLLVLASLGFELSSASACRPRPSSLYKQPTTTDGPLLVGNATSGSTWDHYATAGWPVTSASEPQGSSTWGVMPGSGNSETLPHGGTTVIVSHSTAGADETGSVPLDDSTQPIAISWDGDHTTKKFSSLLDPETTMGTSFPSEHSGGGTNIDKASLTSGSQPSGTDTVDHSSEEGHENEATQSLIPSNSDETLPNTSAPTIPPPPHLSSSHGISEEVPSSPVGSVTSPASETVSTPSEQTQSTDGAKITPTDRQHTTVPTGSQSETDDSTLTGPILSHTFQPTFSHSFTTDVATFTGPMESQDVTSANTEGDDVTTSSSDAATTISEDASLPPVFTATSLTLDDDAPASFQHSQPTEVPSGDREELASLATGTSDEELATKPSDEQTHSDVSATQAPVSILPESTTTTSPGEFTGPVEGTTIPAGPKSTASNDGSLPTSSGLPKTQGRQTTVTGTDGETATWSAVRDPELSNVSQTQTQTDDDSAIIVIFPGGWKWSPVGGGKKGGPTPTAVPTIEGDNEDDPDNEDDEDERCTSTRPPTCTMTMSYYTDDKGEGTSTRIGTCSPVTGCVLGDQSTTTTTVASDIPRITGFLSEDEDDVPPELLPADEELVEYYLDAFKRWGIADTDDAPQPEAECESGVLVNTPLECLELFSGPFCDVVNQDETQQATRNLTFEDVKSKDQQSLLARQSLCASYVFNFDWTGADGDCKLSCSEAFQALKTQCVVPFFDKLAPEGTLDVGCGNYTYQANQEALFDSSSSTLQPSTTSTTTASTTSTEPSSTTTPFSTITSASSTRDAEPTQPNAYFGVHNLQCNKEENYPGHASVQEEALTFEINKACDDMNKKGWHMTPKDDPIEWEYKDYVGVKHRFTWSWKKDCTAENKDVNLGNPLNEDDGVERCVFIFGEAWSKCNNGGVGGSQDVGCVQYWLEAGI
ncbi:hypothetical protein NW768_001011 [Fusarium equiseti]|uniref:Uncharacterized protein n=1 Tax=Fusarium equiseti TaxID=61235 RepID=A0ABQ8RU51_FUSEQ|nr:hypothetical protein NW768_001011 [Fusarium equiseti]